MRIKRSQKGIVGSFVSSPQVLWGCTVANPCACKSRHASGQIIWKPACGNPLDRPALVEQAALHAAESWCSMATSQSQPTEYPTNDGGVSFPCPSRSPQDLTVARTAHARSNSGDLLFVMPLAYLRHQQQACCRFFQNGGVIKEHLNRFAFEVLDCCNNHGFMSLQVVVWLCEVRKNNTCTP